MPDENESQVQGAAQLYGEPFDSRFALAHEHHMAADFAAACAVYGEMLTLAESIEDSPDVRFLRAHVLSDLAIVLLTASDLPGAEGAVERSLALLEGIASAQMGPQGRQLWLETVLKTLIARSDVMSRTGRLDESLACLDEAAALFPEFDDPDGLRAAELGLNRVLLLMNRGEWGRAEEQATLLLSTTPATAAEAVPRLLTALGTICATTGRFDLAEDCFARADDDASGRWGTPGSGRRCSRTGRPSPWSAVNSTSLSGCSPRRPRSSRSSGGSVIWRSVNRPAAISPVCAATPPGRTTSRRRAWTGSSGSAPRWPPPTPCCWAPNTRTSGATSRR